MSVWGIVIALMLAGGAGAQKPSPVFQGTWTATAGPTQFFRGMWSGQASPKNQNVVQGSWTLWNEAGEVQLQGTWSAQKTARGWKGTWTAQTQDGRAFSGTWGADLADFGGKTLGEMLERATAKEVAGSWRSGREQGNWWLKGLQPRGGRR
jgi:hypothetical protein